MTKGRHVALHQLPFATDERLSEKAQKYSRTTPGIFSVTLLEVFCYVLETVLEIFEVLHTESTT